VTDAGRLALVCVGGGLGAGLRFLVLLGFGRHAPWPTLAVNAAGSFALGLLVGCCRDRPAALALLGAGACGGFTTFSTFSLDALALLEKGRPAAATGYVLGSVAASLLGAAIGLRLGR
jgi:CrcB protein